jgi:hypothetical protein
MNLMQLLDATGATIDSELFYADDDYYPGPTLDWSSPEMDFPVGIPGYTEYLSSRGVSREAVDHFQLEIDLPYENVLFPITSPKGLRTGTIVRYMDKAPGSYGKRYMKMGRMWPVWPMGRLRSIPVHDIVVVTEGLFSALRFETVIQNGKSLSLCGARANYDIVSALSAFIPIIVYDNDLAGRKAAKWMKRARPEWTVIVARTSPDDILDDKRLKDLWWRLVDVATRDIEKFRVPPDGAKTLAF